jgi:hypothetical protein
MASALWRSRYTTALFTQIITGWHVHNSELEEAGEASVALWNYLHSGQFISATFENFESEFLQMGLYVVLTIGLRQKGSAESKPLDGPSDVDREPVAHPDAPGR